MDFLVHINAKFALRHKLAEMSGIEFERFFHRLMQLRDPSFVPVSIHQGDQGSDGLSFHDRRLYACYSSSTRDAAAMQQKFRTDVHNAVRHRNAEFDTFVFVHNDTAGVHPDLSVTLANVRDKYPDLKFEFIGEPSLSRQFRQLKQDEMEDLLGHELQVRELSFNVGLDELEPLLEELQKHRVSAPAPGPIPEPKLSKLDFNDLGDAYHDALVTGFAHSSKVERYYAGMLNPNEHDEVAAGFNQHYSQLKDQGLSTTDIMSELESYVVGNRKPLLKEYLAAYVVLAHFFERCHIFENPPEGWSRNTQGGY